MLSGRSRLEVWGDPIAHSRSPQLHAAAYRVLGLEWEYGRRRVAEEDFAATLAGLDDSFRGLSVTFPLKARAFAASARRDHGAELTGAVNTLLLSGDAPAGFNTDIGGLAAALREFGVEAPETARLVGAGATATSALIALASLGARSVEVVARRAEAIEPLRRLGDQLEVRVVPASFDDAARALVDVTVATLPGEAEVSEAVADSLAATGGPLMDVVYGHWPTSLSAAWERNALPAASGLAMLLHQAVLQVRIFTAGSPDVPLDDEQAVLAAMRAAVMGD